MSSSDFLIEDGVLTRYNGSGGDVVIPVGVTQISMDAFHECTGLTIHAPAGSAAEQYVRENSDRIKFEAL